MFTLEEKEVIQDAFTKLELIPSDEFLNDKRFTNEVDKACVIGHLVRLSSDNPSDYSLENCNDRHESIPIRVLSVKFLGGENSHDDSIANYNNEKLGVYQQETSKERSLALLADMLKA
jgi:hypothetical protein